MNKEEIKKLIDESDNIKIQYDKKWRYPKQGDDQNTCPMLNYMFQIEYKSGILIFIPDKINKFGQEGNIKRNQENG